MVRSSSTTPIPRQSNDLLAGISAERFRALNEDPNKPQINRVIRVNILLAAPFKLATAAMALKRGLVTMDSHRRCLVRRLPVWQPALSLLEGRRTRSLDSLAPRYILRRHFYQLGLRVGEAAIFAEARAFGFGQRSGIDLSWSNARPFPRRFAAMSTREA